MKARGGDKDLSSMIDVDRCFKSWDNDVFMTTS